MLKHKLKKLLSEKRMTKSRLARLCNVSPQMVSYWLDGINIPKQDKIYKIAKALEVKPSFLLGFNDEIVLNKTYTIPFINEDNNFGIDEKINVDFCFRLNSNYISLNLKKNDICLFKKSKPSKGDIILYKNNDNFKLKLYDNDIDVIGVLKGYFRKIWKKINI